MAIAYASSGSHYAVPTGTTNWSIPYPATVNAGDLLVMAMSTNGGATITDPSGWTVINNEATIANPHGGVWIKVADGSEGGGTLAVTTTAINGAARIHRYTGVDTTTPLDVTPVVVRNSGASNTVTLTSLTTVTANTMLIYTAQFNSGSNTLTSGTGTERHDFNAQGGTTPRNGGLYDEARAATGSTGTRTITASTSVSGSHGTFFALRPSSGSAFSGSVSLSGSGDLTEAGSPGGLGTLAGTGSGTLGAVQTGMSAQGGGAPRSGSGTLSTSVVVGFSVNAGLTGSGTLTCSGQVVMTGTADLSGSGTQTRSATVSVTGSTSLSGSGTLVVSGVPTNANPADFSGTGTLTTSASSPAITQQKGLSGTGTLTISGVVGVSGAVSLSGSGTQGRSVVVGFSDTRAATGSGSLSAAGTLGFSGSVTLSGTGGLTTSNTRPNFAVNVGLTGSGTLSRSVVVGTTGATSLSGAGTLGVAAEVPFTPVPVDKTNIEPVPYVTINGTDVPTRVDDRGYVALEGLTITWGRSSLLDDVTPAQLSMTIYDSSGEWVQSQPFLGLEIITGVTYIDKAGALKSFRNFRGRIVEAEVEEYVRTDRDGVDLHGYMIHITAVDKLAELGNLFLSNQSWPSENAGARRSRLEGSLSGVVSGLGGPYTTGVTYCSKSFDQKSMLELVREFFGSTAQFMNYDPDTNRVESVDRLEYGGEGLRLGEIDNRPGTYGLELDAALGSVNRADYVLDAGSLIPRSGIRRTIESTITEIKYEYPSDAANSSRSTFTSTTNLPSESVYGKRTFAASSEVIDNVASFTTAWNILVRAAQGWSPPDVEWDTRIPERGFQSNPHINTMLRGRVYLDPLFISRSVYNAFPMLNATTGTLRVRLPIYMVIGGEMTYAADASGDMGWVVRPKFASVVYYSDWTPLTWNTINPSAPGNTVSWAELDENVTWTDINLTGQGV